LPTYEYLCVECGNRKEVVQSFTDESLTTCELCGGRLRKVIFPVGIQFKGSGFYSTDRRASQPMSRHNNKDKDKESKGESGADTKSEKSEAKAESNSDSKKESKTDSSSKTDSGSSTKKAVETTG